MSGELLIRFVVGGLVVSFFAILGDIFRPKSFAGLFAAAPSVALATLGMAIVQRGGAYGALEGRSMAVGAAALCAYSLIASWWLMRYRVSALRVTLACLAVWFGVAFGGWALLLR